MNLNQQFIVVHVCQGTAIRCWMFATEEEARAKARKIITESRTFDPEEDAIQVMAPPTDDVMTYEPTLTSNEIEEWFARACGGK